MADTIERIIPPRRREDWFDANGQLSLRALRFFEGLTGVTNEVTTIINESTEETIGSLSAKVARLESQVGSGIPLTIDTTGFTVDTTKQFTDQTEVS